MEETGKKKKSDVKTLMNLTCWYKCTYCTFKQKSNILKISPVQPEKIVALLNTSFTPADFCIFTILQIMNSFKLWNTVVEKKKKKNKIENSLIIRKSNLQRNSLPETQHWHTIHRIHHRSLECFPKSSFILVYIYVNKWIFNMWIDVSESTFFFVAVKQLRNSD